ncbi:hypothetical protein LPJ59_004613 [Coemansia sp. RSA 2399]|nr:hypothetical protein LPJ59_004613 [Coemansia sp. RSA 2399]
MSPETRSKVMGFTISFFPADSHMFRLSFQKLRALREAVLSSKLGDGHSVSDNDIITALLCMVVIQCNKGHGSVASDEPRSSFFRQSKKIEQRLITIAVDSRYRLGNRELARYTGNGILSHILAFPLQDICADIEPMSLARCALRVREGVDRISPQYVREYIDLGDSAPDCFQRLMAYMMRVPTRFCVSSQARMDFYGVDFGNGRPMWVSPPKTYVPGYSSILPAPRSSGDFLIYLSVKGSIMSKVLCHPFWNSMVELVY